MKTAEEWHQSQLCVNAENEVDSMQDFIRAIQADALEAAANQVDLPLTYDPRDPFTPIAQRIRALIPTAPGTPPPGEPSKTPGHRKSGT